MLILTARISSTQPLIFGKYSTFNVWHGILFVCFQVQSYKQTKWNWEGGGGYCRIIMSGAGPHSVIVLFYCWEHAYYFNWKCRLQTYNVKYDKENENKAAL